MSVASEVVKLFAVLDVSCNSGCYIVITKRQFLYINHISKMKAYTCTLLSGVHCTTLEFLSSILSKLTLPKARRVFYKQNIAMPIMLKLGNSVKQVRRLKPCCVVVIVVVPGAISMALSVSYH